ncbi:MAG: hypothetical protein NVS3B26_28120 [Mycobacteriales bacterium]
MTSRLLVVSGNPGLGMLLAQHGYDVDDCRPGGKWWAAAAEANALVLDLGTVADAARALTRLPNPSPPMLLVGLADEEWNQLAVRWDAPLLCLPLAPADVLRQVRELLKAGAAPAQPSPAQPTADEWQRAERTAAAAGTGLSKVIAPVEPRTSAASSREHVGRTRPGSAVAPPLTVVERRSATRVHVNDTAMPSAAAHPYAAVLSETGVTDLVGQLLARLPDVASLGDVAAAILMDAVMKCQAQAGAVLVKDGAVWTVQAGHGLRPVEERLHVAEDSWLIEQIIHQGRGLLVEDSDIARQRLAGLPVASWTNIAAAPLGARRAVVILGADERVFSEADLTALRALDQEAEQLIDRAVHVRALARALLPFADQPEAPVDAATR